MHLPMDGRAVVDPAKIRAYCLDQEHPEGMQKARVFRSVLGITAQDWIIRRDMLLAAARHGIAERGREDRYGVRYVVRSEVATKAERATLLSPWFIKAGEEIPRMVTCYTE